MKLTVPAFGDMLRILPPPAKIAPPLPFSAMLLANSGLEPVIVMADLSPEAYIAPPLPVLAVFPVKLRLSPVRFTLEPAFA